MQGERSQQAVLKARAGAIRLMLVDNDGTLTDGSVYYGPEGEALIRYSRRDGMGFELLREAGIAGGILTRERSPMVGKRARKLGLQHLFEGVRDKGLALADVLSTTGMEKPEIAYMGDDLNDLGVMQALEPAGLLGAPADAHQRIRALAHFVAPEPGGCGAFRSFAEWLLEQREAP